MTDIFAPARSTAQLLDMDPTEASKPLAPAPVETETREPHRLAELFRLEPASPSAVPAGLPETGVKLLTT